MNKTMIGTVQRVLSDLNFEQVNSIFDTDDAEAVARIVMNVHSAVLTEYPWVIKETLLKPISIEYTTLLMSKGAQRVKKIRYTPSNKCKEETKVSVKPREEDWMPRVGGSECEQCCTTPHRPSTYTESSSYSHYRDNMTNFTMPDRDGWQPPCRAENTDDCVELTYLDMEDFLAACKSSARKCPTACPVVEIKDTGCSGRPVRTMDLDPEPSKPVMYQIEINNNKDPEYWTVIDNQVVLDSFCFRDGSRILEDRLMIIGQNVDELQLRDEQIVNLPLEFYNYMLAEILSTASYTLIDKPNEKEEARSQRLRRRLLREHGLQGKKRHSIDRNVGSYWRG